MIERDPIGNDARARAREARLGIEPSCLICVERDLPALEQKEIPAKLLPPRLLEEHHLAGRTNDPEATVLVCRNCHSKLTWMQLQSGADLLAADERSMPEKLIELLNGLILLFETLAEACERWAEWLRAFVVSLDEGQPGWRELQAATG